MKINEVIDKLKLKINRDEILIDLNDCIFYFDEKKMINLDLTIVDFQNKQKISNTFNIIIYISKKTKFKIIKMKDIIVLSF